MYYVYIWFEDLLIIYLVHHSIIYLFVFCDITIDLFSFLFAYLLFLSAFVLFSLVYMFDVK